MVDGGVGSRQRGRRLRLLVACTPNPLTASLLPTPAAHAHQGATSAEQTSDPSFAANAGVPLPDGYAPPPVPPPTTPLTANPCIQQDAGYSTGLAAAFYETPFGAAADARKSQPGLDFGGAPAFRRCVCGGQGLWSGHRMRGWAAGGLTLFAAPRRPPVDPVGLPPSASAATAPTTKSPTAPGPAPHRYPPP